VRRLRHYAAWPQVVDAVIEAQLEIGKNPHNVLLMTINPASDHGNEVLQVHRVSRIESRDMIVHPGILPAQGVSIG
jgi:hypothetical protein